MFFFDEEPIRQLSTCISAFDIRKEESVTYLKIKTKYYLHFRHYKRYYYFKGEDIEESNFKEYCKFDARYVGDYNYNIMQEIRKMQIYLYNNEKEKEFDELEKMYKKNEK